MIYPGDAQVKVFVSLFDGDMEINISSPHGVAFMDDDSTTLLSDRAGRWVFTNHDGVGSYALYAVTDNLSDLPPVTIRSEDGTQRLKRIRLENVTAFNETMLFLQADQEGLKRISVSVVDRDTFEDLYDHPETRTVESSRRLDPDEKLRIDHPLTEREIQKDHLTYLVKLDSEYSYPY